MPQPEMPQLVILPSGLAYIAGVRPWQAGKNIAEFAFERTASEVADCRHGVERMLRKLEMLGSITRTERNQIVNDRALYTMRVRVEQVPAELHYAALQINHLLAQGLKFDPRLLENFVEAA